jgi:predicted HTH domain antitoxin
MNSMINGKVVGLISKISLYSKSGYTVGDISKMMDMPIDEVRNLLLASFVIGKL